MQKAVLVFIFCVLLNEVSPKVAIDKEQLTNKKKALAKQLGPHVPKWGELASYSKEPKSTQNKSKSLLNLLKVVTAKEIDVPDNTFVGNITIKNATLDNSANKNKTSDATNKNNENIDLIIKTATNETTFPKVQNNITYKANTTVNKTKKKYLANETIGGRLASMKLNTTTEKPKLPDIVPPTMIPIFKPMQTSPRNAPTLSNDLIRQEIPEDLNQQQIKTRLDSNSTNTNQLQNNDIRNEYNQKIRENRTYEMRPNTPNNLQNNIFQKDNGKPINYDTMGNNNETLFIENIKNPNKHISLKNGFTQQPNMLTEIEVSLLLNSMAKLINSNNANSVQNGNTVNINAVRNGFYPNNIVSSQENAFKQEQITLNVTKDQSVFNSIHKDQSQNTVVPATTSLNENRFNVNNLNQNVYNPTNPKPNGFAENGINTRNPRNPNENVFDPENPNVNGFKANHQNQNGFNAADTNQNRLGPTNSEVNGNVENGFNSGNLNENGFNPRNSNENGSYLKNSVQSRFIPGNIYLDENGPIIGNSNQNAGFNPNTIPPNQNGLNSANLNDNRFVTGPALANIDQVGYNPLNTNQNIINPRNTNLNDESNPVAYQSKLNHNIFNVDQHGFVPSNEKQIQKELVHTNNHFNQNGFNPNNLHGGVYPIPQNPMNVVPNELNTNDRIGNNLRRQNNFINAELNGLITQNNNLNLQQSRYSNDMLDALNTARLLAKTAKSDNNFQSISNEATLKGLNTQFSPEKDVTLNIFPSENMRMPPNPETLRQTVDAITKTNSKAMASRFSLPCLKASDILGDLYQPNVQITKPILDPVTEVPSAKLQHEKPKIDGNEDEESVAIVFKPKNISLLKFYGDLLKKITLTVLVPYHISKLTGSDITLE